MEQNYSSKIFTFRTVALTAISALLLALTVHNSGLQWSHLQISIEQWGYLLLAVLVMLLAIWVQAQRVKIIWHSDFANNQPDILNGIMIGNLYNCILPGNLGEGIRAWHLSKKNKVPFIKALASLGVEKYMSALDLMVYSGVLVLLFSDIDIHFNVIITIGFLAGGVFLFYLLVISKREIEKPILGFLLHFFSAGRWLCKLHYHIKFFLKQFNKQKIIKYLLLGYLTFSLNVLQYFIVMKATALPDSMISFRTAFLVSIGMALVYVTPSAPGNVGVVHYGIYSLLISVAAAYGIHTAPPLLQSFALYTVYLHLSYFLPEVVLGAVVLFREKKWLF